MMSPREDETTPFPEMTPPDATKREDSVIGGGTVSGGTAGEGELESQSRHFTSSPTEELGSHTAKNGSGPAALLGGQSTRKSRGTGGSLESVPHSEIRIALAMCGGIALTLYEAGVSHELYRFYHAWEDYAANRKSQEVTIPDYDKCSDNDSILYESSSVGYLEAFERMPIRPVIDILTGASAGGINSIFLASCVATGQDFGQFHDVWINVADIENLQFKSNEPARAILNTEALRTNMLEKLKENSAAYLQLKAKNKKKFEELQSIDLFVRLCRTHHKGHTLSTTDAIGHQVDVSAKADIINFRTKHFRPASTPAEDTEQEHELARAALATSAFPGMFPPVFDPNEGRWYVDGGLWDNQPIDLAVEAIQDKPAFTRTHRCLFFVEPNPSLSPTCESLPAQIEHEEPSQTDILQSLLFMGLKGNVWPALQSILRFNQRIHLYDRLAEDPGIATFLENFGGQQFQESIGQLKLAKDWFRKSKPADGLKVKDWVTAAAKPGVDPLSLTPLNEKRIHALLFDDDPALIQQWHAALERLGCLPCKGRGNSDMKEEGAVALLTALAAIKSVGMTDIELWMIQGKLQQLNGELASREAASWSDEVRLGKSARKAALYTRLAEIESLLYDDSTMEGARPHPQQAETNNRFRQKANRSRSRFRAASVKLLDDLQELFGPFRGSPLPQPARAKALTILTQWLYRVRSEAAAIRRSTAIAAFHMKMDRPSRPSNQVESAQAQAQVQQAYFANPTCRQLARRIAASPPTTLLTMTLPITSSPTTAKEALASYLESETRALAGELRNDIQVLKQQNRPASAAVPTIRLSIALYVLASVSDLIDKRTIDLVRISGNDTDNTHLLTDDALKGGNTPAQRKLAGEGLGHVLGFLENRWRRNDYVWGRLDACEILLRTLRLYGSREGFPVTDEDRQKLRKELQDTYTRLVGDPCHAASLGPDVAAVAGVWKGATNAVDYAGWIQGMPAVAQHLCETDPAFLDLRRRAFGGMTDLEYKLILRDAQSAILRQETRLYAKWYKQVYGEYPLAARSPKSSWRDAIRLSLKQRLARRPVPARNSAHVVKDAGSGGLLRASDAQLQPTGNKTFDETAQVDQSTDERAKRQRANAHVIGYGYQTLLDADEPGLSQKVNYLTQVAVRLARGSSDKAPAQLELLARLVRLLSYVMMFATYIIPINVHRRTTHNVSKLVGAIMVLLVVAAMGGYFYGQPGQSASLSAVSTLPLKYTAICLMLIAVGCLLGFHGLPLSFAMLFLGIALGVLVTSEGVPKFSVAHWIAGVKTPGGVFWCAALGMFLCTAQHICNRRARLKK